MPAQAFLHGENYAAESFSSANCVLYWLVFADHGTLPGFERYLFNCEIIFGVLGELRQ